MGTSARGRTRTISEAFGRIQSIGATIRERSRGVARRKKQQHRCCGGASHTATDVVGYGRQLAGMNLAQTVGGFTPNLQNMTLKLRFSQTKFSFEIHLHIYKLCSKNQDAGDVESEDASAKMASQSIRLQEIEQENAKLKNRLDRYQKAIANSKEFEKCVGASTTEPLPLT